MCILAKTVLFILANYNPYKKLVSRFNVAYVIQLGKTLVDWAIFDILFIALFSTTYDYDDEKKFFFPENGGSFSDEKYSGSGRDVGNMHMSTTCSFSFYICLHSIAYLYLVACNMSYYVSPAKIKPKRP